MSCTDMIYLDFAKAFDKVDHGVLLHKLKQLGITGKLGNWLLSSLSNRNHFVRILGGVSSDGSVLSGVPQGTVLEPLLFLVLLSDISSDINHSSVVSFADDTRVYRQINEISDCSLLQNDSKFQHMSYHHQLQHRSCNHIYLSPSMNIINSNDHIRDLGIIMSGDCSFNEHINMRTKQCRQLTGWILCTFKARDKCVMLTLFKSLVLPRLEYGCQLWSPTSVNQINAIENIQRKFTKHITGMHSLSYENRLKCLNLYSLIYNVGEIDIQLYMFGKSWRKLFQIYHLSCV